jgi:hypothetical protein
VQVALGLFVSPPTLQALSRPRFETRRNILVGFALLTFAAIVIRLELIALIAPFALENLLQGSVGLVELAVTGTVSALLSLGAFPSLSSVTRAIRARSSPTPAPSRCLHRCRHLLLAAARDLALARRIRVLVQRRRGQVGRMGRESTFEPYNPARVAHQNLTLDRSRRRCTISRRPSPDCCTSRSSPPPSPSSSTAARDASCSLASSTSAS